ncbi:MAG TPA: DUF305 domain-containing protein [Cryptosporangiaceae bacterium]|nr:DUF305 domain-containing protein [Cryptosporangiaceae bacterium]
MVEQSLAAEQAGEAPAPPRRPGWWLIALAVALLAMAVGFLGGVVTASPRSPADDSAEAGFARDMITHHAQAVAMSISEYRTTSDAGLRQIAVDIALTQQGQIGMMSTWLDTWGLGPTGQAPPMAWMHHHGGGPALLPDGRMPGMASAAEMEQLRTGSGRDKDVLFCRLMIAHHIGGVQMTEAILAVTEDDQVRALAEAMKTGQQSEIATLQDVLKRLGATP